MNLRDVSYAMRVVGDVARAGERLLDAFEDSRRLHGWPVVFGIGVGFGIGTLVFSDEARRRTKAWLGKLRAPLIAAGEATEAHVEPSP